MIQFAKLNRHMNFIKNGWAQNWFFVQDAGHSATEPGIIKALVDATQKMKVICP